MTAFLKHTLDKFTFSVATDRYYSVDGVWAKEEGGRVLIGLSDFAQQRSGDVAFVDVVEPGTVLALGEVVANIETIKVDIDLASPVTGTVVEVNLAMEDEPDVINQDPYGQGWLAIIAAADWLADRLRLLDPQAYYEHMKSEAEAESSSK